MRTSMILLALLAAGCAVDSDGDRSLASEDCDDDDPARFPGNTEICDGIDNDCNDVVDDDATDLTAFFVDVDGDGFGDDAKLVRACVAPDKHVPDNTDCDDSDADVNPGATEVCDGGVDNDCDDLADDADDSLDLATAGRFWADSDRDSYGDPAVEIRACERPDGAASNAEDCDDDDELSYPGAEEICDGTDNDCDDVADSGLAGDDPICAATSCAAIVEQRTTAGDGRYFIDPVGDDAFEAFCDMTTDGGGWTLVTWTGDSTQLTEQGFSAGVPYPGLVVCDTLDCQRGSAATVDRLEAVIRGSGELGLGHSIGSLRAFGLLGAHDYAVSYDYGDLSGMDLVLGETTPCDATGLATGTTHVLAGPTDHDGTAVFVAQSFRYFTTPYDETGTYIWNMASVGGACSGSGAAPGVYLGNWSTSEHEYGPYLSSTDGARSVWAR